MLLSVVVRNLVFASWRVPPEAVAAKLPPGLEPELAGETGLVTLSLARATEARLGRLRVPSFSKYTVHTYARAGAETGLCFLDMRVSYSGLGSPLVGVPARTTLIRVREGLAAAPSLRAALRYRRNGPAAPPELESGPVGSHDVAFFEAAGLRRLIAFHDPLEWEEAELAAPAMIDPVLALGFDVGEPDSLLYADRTGFRVELPPARR